MTALQGLKIITHLVVLLGFLSLKITGNIHTIVFIVSVLFVFYSFLGDYGGYVSNLSSKISTLLGSLLIIFLVIGYIFLKLEFFTTLIYFLVFLQIIKLISNKNINDYRQLIALGFFQILAVSVTTIGIGYGVLCFVFLVMSTTGIILHNICTDSHKYLDSDNSKIFHVPLLKIIIPGVIMVLVLSSLVFLSMPRFRKSFISSPFVQPNNLKSGFSDQVNLGEVGKIKEDNDPVMRVKILNRKNGKIKRTIYWRGATLDKFDGNSWISEEKKKNVRYENSNGIIVLRKTDWKDQIKQEIIEEPLNTDVLFAADIPSGYKNIPFNKLKHSRWTNYTYRPLNARIKYIAYSDISEPDKSDLSNDNEYPYDITSTYLDNKYTNKELKELAQKLYDPNATTYRNVVNVKNYLQSNYRYTRNLDSKRGGLSLEDFLLRKKEGHCEYFATAMAVLLQNMNIPARIVTGFMGGEYNDRGQFYTVRQSDAHAWVEVYFNSSGWVRFDPTPASDSANTNSYFLSSYIEYLEYKWNRYVVDFDAKDQKRIFSNFKNGLDNINYRIRQFNIDKFGLNKLLYDLIIIFITISFIFIYRYREEFRSYRHKKNISDAAVIYKKALNEFRSRGISKQSHITSTEFCEFINANHGNKIQSFQRFTEIYLESRFGNNKKQDRITELHMILNRIRNNLKKIRL